MDRQDRRNDHTLTLYAPRYGEAFFCQNENGIGLGLGLAPRYGEAFFRQNKSGIARLRLQVYLVLQIVLVLKKTLGIENNTWY